MSKYRIAYLGADKKIHDKRFIKTLRKQFEVHEIFTSQITGALNEQQFSKFDLIICGPLVGTIEYIPKKVKVPILGMSHALELNSKKEDKYLRENLSRCRSIIVDCLHSQKILKDVFQYKNFIYLFAYGCDFSYFAKTQVKYESKPMICTLRNWYQQYNNSLIIESAKKLIDVRIDLSLICMGDGPLLAAEAKKIFNSKYSKNIKFEGSFDRVGLKKCFEKNWMYISAAESDGSSVSLLEALSAGMICIVNDFPSNLEWIQDGINGFLFNLEDPDTLIDAIRKSILLTPNQKKEIGMAAKKSVSIRGNWEINSKVFIQSVNQNIRIE